MPIEIESVGNDQRDIGSFDPGAKVVKQGERVPITAFTNNSRRTESRPDFDSSEDPQRNSAMLKAIIDCAPVPAEGSATHLVSEPTEFASAG